MNALRHLLLRDGAASRWIQALVLIVLVARALMSSAVMLDPDAPDPGSMVLCSGQGPLRLDVDSRGASARFDAHAPITLANDASALAAQLSRHAHRPSGSGSTPADRDGLCAFGAMLFVALASAVLLILLFAVAASRQRFSRRASCRAVGPRIGDRPPSRAPPVFAFV